MINWNEYITTKSFIKYRCNICREWFDEKDDIKVHIKEWHNIDEVIEIKLCKECENLFVPIMDDQVICGRQKCVCSQSQSTTKTK